MTEQEGTRSAPAAGREESAPDEASLATSERAASGSQAAPPGAAPRHLAVEFTGTGEEYFRIWIVNLLLTVVTLGIYSAWAKVQRLQYFYRNTRLDGDVFNYHGRPGAILKGRVVAFVLIYIYNFAAESSIIAGVLAAAVLAGAMPWLLAQAQRFRLHNTSYRGLRFRFLASTRESYAVFGVPLVVVFALLAVLSYLNHESRNGAEPGAGIIVLAVGCAVLLALWPYQHFRFKRYQHAHCALGNTSSTFAGRASRFYAAYAIALLLLFVGVVVGIFFIAGFSGRSGLLATVGFVYIYASLLAFVQIVAARVQNHVWNRTRLGPIGFASAVKPHRLVWIGLSNIVLTVLTVGLFTPFAAVRTARYKLEAVTVIAADDLTNFVGAASAEVAAIGEGAADLLDVDFAL